MRYQAYRLSFPIGIHIGTGTLEESTFSFGADTLFSALCIEANKNSMESMEHFISLVKNNEIIFSDALPYVDGQCYIPKPMVHIQTSAYGNSIQKKAFKKLDYIPACRLEQFLHGDFDAHQEVKLFKKKLGRHVSKTSASVRGNEETVPYRVGVYQFFEQSGLYLIIGYENDDTLQFVVDLLDALSFSGIGGKRSSGLGRFSMYPLKLEPAFATRLTAEGKTFMALSVSLPKNEELEHTLVNARYLIMKRSGFVASDTYAESLQRKRNLYVFRAGSCFEHIFEGDIYDVSGQGSHAVYRYAKPMFMEVGI